MAPPIDYSKWDNIDTDSDSDDHSTPIAKGKQPDSLNKLIDYPRNEDDDQAAQSKLSTKISTKMDKLQLQESATTIPDQQEHSSNNPGFDHATKKTSKISRSGCYAFGMDTSYIDEKLRLAGFDPDEDLSKKSNEEIHAIGRKAGLYPVIIEPPRPTQQMEARKAAKSSASKPSNPQFLGPEHFEELGSRTWLDSSAFIKMLTAKCGPHNRETFRRPELIDIMRRQELAYKKEYAAHVMAQTGLSGGPIDVNHGGRQITTLGLHGGNDNSAPGGRLYEVQWNIKSTSNGQLDITPMYNLELHQIHAWNKGFRTLSLAELEEEWDTIIERIHEHQNTLPADFADTKIENFLHQLSHQVHGKEEEDFYHTYMAMQFAILQHRDFVIHKDDFTVFNDPRALCSTTHHKACLYSCEFIAMFASPKNIDIITKLFAEMPGKDPSGVPSHLRAEGSQDLPHKVNAIHKKFRKAGNDRLKVLLVCIDDVVSNDMHFAERKHSNGGDTANLSHRFALAIGTDGVAILQSYIFMNGFAIGLHDWLNSGHAGVRPWPEFQTWLDAFKIVATPTVSSFIFRFLVQLTDKDPQNRWSNESNSAWRTCFTVDIMKIIKPDATGKRYLEGTWSPFVSIFEIPNVQHHDLSKFTWKLDSYRDEEGGRKLRSTWPPIRLMGR